MLELKELAQFFTDELNNIGKIQDPKYEFLVHAELGTQKPRVTCGVLRVDEPIISPIDNILNINYKGSVEFSVRTPESNFHLINVEKIIGILVEKFNGKNVEFSKGNGVLNLSYSRAKNFKIEAGVGQMTPLSFSFAINYSENVVIEAKKHWFIKEIGENKEFLEIPFLTERVLVEKDGKINPINDRKYKQAFMMTQQRTYSFTMPYESSNGVASMLTKDILTGDANKNYILKYYDGIAFTEDEPFLTQVVLYRNGDNGGTKPNSSILNLLFTDSDDGKNSTKYFMALIDNSFDGTTENTRWFDSQSEQIEWFEKRIKIGANFDSIDAPNLNSLVLTSQIYKNSREYDVFDLVNKNYAIIRVEKNVGDEVQKKYYYYKVADANIGANNQVIYDLRLDSLQTWFFRDDIVVEDSFISKAHLDRFVDIGEGLVTFDGYANSKLFSREDIRQVATRLTQRSKLRISGTGKNISGICNWINNNVLCWVYVLVGAKEFQLVDWETNKATGGCYISQARAQRGNDVSYSIDYGYAILCYPMLKADALLRFQSYKVLDNETQYIININAEGLDAFLNLNSGYSHVYGLKLSMKPPIHLNTLFDEYDYEIDDNVLTIKNAHKSTVGQFGVYYKSLVIPSEESLEGGIITDFIGQSSENNEKMFNGLIHVTADELDSYIMTFDSNPIEGTFEKSEIIGAIRDKKFNPKINSLDYKQLRVTFAGSSFDFDMQKINKFKRKGVAGTGNIFFSYNEMITADISKVIIKLKEGSQDEVFNQFYSDSFNGFLMTNDLSLPYSTEQYDTYIANNKNAYLSFQAQQNYARDSANLEKKYATIDYGINQTKNVYKMFSGDVSSGLGGVAEDTAKYVAQMSEISDRTNLNLDYQKTQFDMSIDNMKNAPDSLTNANGNPIFIFAVSEFGIYAEIYEGLDTELESANDIMFRDGFNLNRFAETGKTLKDYCHTRKYFNYIRATIGNISGVAMSDTMRADLKQRFSNGIRFWHQDKIDYSMENYELKLEEGEQNV